MTRTPGMFLILALSLGFYAAFFSAPRAEAASIYIYVDPDSGSDSSIGRIDSPVRSIERALDLAGPGEKVRLTSGVYREDVITIRGGTSSLPITIEAAPGAQPVIDGGGFRTGPQILHSYIVFRGIEVKNMRFGMRIEGARNVVVRDSVIHGVGGECLRLQYGAFRNTVLNNRIFDCGLVTNGEGIYVGTAPEQSARNSGQPDRSTNNVIDGNEIFRVTEGIDLKEDANYNTVRFNTVSEARDPNSGGINIRSDSNNVYGNSSRDSAGSGFRIGGDIVDGRQHGLNNRLRDNTAADNLDYGYKIMVTPQNIDCSNRAFRNLLGAFTAGDGCV